MSPRSLAPLLIGLALAAAACSGESGPAERPRRIVLLSIDTLRADAFTRESMPRTRAFFDRGARFTRFFSATSTTQPTHASLLTGQHPWDHGVVRNGLVLGEEHETIAEILAERGFRTLGVTSSFPVKGALGFGQGFDRFDDDFAQTYADSWAGEDVAGRAFYSLAPDSVARARAALDDAEGEDQFLWLHLFDPHDPYGDAAGKSEHPVCQLPQLEMIGIRGHESFDHWLGVTIEQYHADVRAMDAQLGALLERIAAEESEYETLVVLTADHGESLGEGGTLGHGERVHSAEIHVPLAIVGEGWDAGERADVAGTVDVAETLLVWAGAPAGTTAGRDLAKVLEGSMAVGMRRVLAEETFEIRLDGTRHDQRVPRFYAVEDGEILYGEGDRIVRADDPDRAFEPADERLARFFAGAAEALASRSAEELRGGEVDAALEALGYR